MPNIFNSITPERGINIVCLIISAAAPALAIGPVIGIPTGAVAALGLLAVMAGQSSTNAAERRQAYVGAWIIRAFVICFEQMAYQDAMSFRASLPFGFGAVAWSWAAVCFMAVLDLWAYSRTAARAEAEAEAAAEAASFERIQAAESAARLERIELAKIKTQGETEKKALEEKRRAQEAALELERIRLESAEKQRESERMEAERALELERIRQEELRNRQEAERMEAERIREQWRTAKKRAAEKKKAAGNRPETELSILEPQSN